MEKNSIETCKTDGPVRIQSSKQNFKPDALGQPKRDRVGRGRVRSRSGWGDACVHMAGHINVVLHHNIVGKYYSQLK